MLSTEYGTADSYSVSQEMTSFYELLKFVSVFAKENIKMDLLGMSL
jgi:hypothetical protein